MKSRRTYKIFLALLFVCVLSLHGITAFSAENADDPSVGGIGLSSEASSDSSMPESTSVFEETTPEAPSFLEEEPEHIDSSFVANNAEALQPSAILMAPLSTTIVSNQSELQAALNAREPNIEISTSFVLTASLSITLMGNEEYSVSISSPSEVTLEVNGAFRHIQTNIATYAALTISFEKVGLDGKGTAGGGGISQTGGSLVLNRANIYDCNTAGSGGAVYTNSILHISNGSFGRNTAVNGGAVAGGNRSNVEISNSTFLNNTAERISGDDTGCGGAVFVGDDSRLTLTTCSFTGNKAIGRTTYNKNDTNDMYSASTTGMGGAVTSWKNSTTTVDQCTFTSNTATNFGGGLLSHNNGILTVLNSTFSKNETPSSSDINDGSKTFGTGGGICVASTGTADIQDTDFLENVAEYGGGVRIEPSLTVTIQGGTFSKNKANQFGGAINVSGASGQSSSLGVTGTNFTENTALKSGGALALNAYSNAIITSSVLNKNTATTSGGGIFSNTNTTLTLNQTNASQNSAEYGGFIFLSTALSAAAKATASINDGSFSQNTATSSFGGGAICASNYAKLDIVGGGFSNNSAPRGGAISAYTNSEINIGGAATFTTNTSASLGGAIYTAGNTLTIGGSSSFTGNEAAEGGAVAANTNSIVTIKDTAQMTNNTASANGGAIRGNSPASITVTDSAKIANNTAVTAGGAIASNGNFSTITVSGQAVIEGNRASYGGGISSLTDVSDTTTPAINLYDNSKITDNIASVDGGGVWVKNLEQVTASANVTFSGNTASQAYYMESSAADAAVHATNILTSSRSGAPLGNSAFTYAYNNYDIVYTAGTPSTDMVQVTFDAAGGSPALTQKITDRNSSLEANMPLSPVRQGYTFLGWYSGQNGSGTEFTSTTIITADMTVYASWEDNSSEPASSNPAQASYRILYDVNWGGYGTSQIQDQTGYLPGQSVILRDTIPVRPGYTFSHWNTLPSGTGTSYGPQNTLQIINSNVTLYAQWAYIQHSSSLTSSVPSSSGAAGSSSSPVSSAPTISSSSSALSSSSIYNAGDDEVPLWLFRSSHWALVNLILMLLGIIGAIALLIKKFFKHNKAEHDYNSELEMNTNEEGKKQSSATWRVLAVLAAVLSLIVFILTEDMRMPMVLVDFWTFFMILIAVVEVVAIVLSLKKKVQKYDDEDD